MKRDIVNQYRKIQADFWNEWGSLSKEFHLLRENVFQIYLEDPNQAKEIIRELHNVLKHFKENSRR
jgi:predicted choloylglycine hydrolase